MGSTICFAHALLALLPERRWFSAEEPVVSLRFTTGYWLRPFQGR